MTQEDGLIIKLYSSVVSIETLALFVPPMTTRWLCWKRGTTEQA